MSRLDEFEPDQHKKKSNLPYMSTEEKEGDEEDLETEDDDDSDGDGDDGDE